MVLLSIRTLGRTGIGVPIGLGVVAYLVAHGLDLTSVMEGFSMMGMNFNTRWTGTFHPIKLALTVVGLFAIVYLALPSQADIWGPGIWALAALSMTVANLSALRQSNIVRLLAYSSIAHAGYLLLGVMAMMSPGRGSPALL